MPSSEQPTQHPYRASCQACLEKSEEIGRLKALNCQAPNCQAPINHNGAIWLGLAVCGLGWSVVSVTVPCLLTDHLPFPYVIVIHALHTLVLFVLSMLAYDRGIAKFSQVED